MINKIWFCVLLVLMVSCSDNKTISIPDDVLPKEKMAAVFVDMHLMEASMNISGVGPERINFTGSSGPIHIDVLTKNNITLKQYQDSYLFYAHNPTVLSEVYQLVLNDFSKMQTEVQKKK